MINRLIRILRRLLRSRTTRFLLLTIAIWNIAEVLLIRHRLYNADNAQPDLSRRHERIYIASIHWNNGPVLRDHWNDAVVKLAETIGPENIFVSIFESGSWDDSKAALFELDSALDRIGVRRNITVSDVTHADEIAAPPAEHGWIDTPRGRKELRRIPYLSRLRNVSLQPMYDLLREGVTFDRILFLNDVVFTTDDVMTLLNTNHGEYAAACSLDFSKPPRYYDTFALRDSDGHKHVMQTWPYFRSSKSRAAMKSMSPVPVKSCWNGMVAMPVGPFVSDPPLEFRGVPDNLAASHVEGSECCLVHADNPLSKKKGVYLNPKVRVGYSGPAYSAVNPAQRWLSPREIFLSGWENRFRRLFTTPRFEDWAIQRIVSKWKSQDKRHEEPGEFCLINEMQVLVWNGWAHV
ncbi:hypothetical protein N7510_006108 [Penicillium lagena]|uniref:uncharacterized protein n=1 Tax=Penicillium lagena TaxID=94218 RepID=UPI0025413C84|nr:uncharacterized protein N7510_006108 [Penicillium lagena]KAJ5612914.1 hypothetical protein N7510_006108 [Penicillium lagena]